MIVDWIVDHAVAGLVLIETGVVAFVVIDARRRLGPPHDTKDR